MAKAKNAYTKIYEKNRNTMQKSAKGEKTAADNAYKASTANINANFKQSEKQATTLYRQGQNALKSELAGVSGTTKNKLEVNYGGNLETNNVGKAAATASAKQVKDTTKSNATQNYYSKKADLKKDSGTNKIKRNDTIAKNKLTTYKNTISRYTTTASIDKAIKNMKKSNDYYKSAKVSYLRGQRAKIVAAEKAKAAAAAKAAARSYSRSRSYSTGTSRNYSGNSTRSTNRTSNRRTKTNWNNLYGQAWKPGTGTMYLNGKSGLK